MNLNLDSGELSQLLRHSGLLLQQPQVLSSNDLTRFVDIASRTARALDAVQYALAIEARQPASRVDAMP